MTAIRGLATIFRPPNMLIRCLAESPKTHFGFKTATKEEKSEKVNTSHVCSETKFFDVIGVHRLGKKFSNEILDLNGRTRLLDVSGSIPDDGYRFFEKSDVKQHNDLAARTVVCDMNEETLKIGQKSPEIHPAFTIDWKTAKTIPDEVQLSDQITYYLRLSKFRLTSLVVATTMAGFVMGNPTGFVMDPTLVAATLIGTGLTSASAASLNQFLEIPFDSQMVRTRNRPLVTAQMTPTKAFTFATISGITGLTILSTMVNPLTAALGLTNLLLYSFIYTPLKRINIVNTWIGSFVGAIPPVMGYTAITGGIDPSGLLLGAILYSWQFPHFNALSWNLRHDYARAGYRMMSVTDPKLCLRTQLRHSLYLTGYCLLLSHPSVGLTDWTFMVDSLPFNLYLVYLSYKFWSEAGSSTSRRLFRYSLLHLPVIILLMIISKKTTSKVTSEAESSRQTR